MNILLYPFAMKTKLIHRGVENYFLAFFPAQRERKAVDAAACMRVCITLQPGGIGIYYSREYRKPRRLGDKSSYELRVCKMKRLRRRAGRIYCAGYPFFAPRDIKRQNYAAATG